MHSCHAPHCTTKLVLSPEVDAVTRDAFVYHSDCDLTGWLCVQIPYTMMKFGAPLSPASFCRSLLSCNLASYCGYKLVAECAASAVMLIL